ncbi:hypothetical protein [Hyphobacterium indicum]|uniref:hypothetical protein n=1 Tax=Hyphobacterium indicum TaxID=2162714 RepID=UPI000D64C11B|nr:hypothetical protein [Hyphobacterium indicum]
MTQLKDIERCLRGFLKQIVLVDKFYASQSELVRQMSEFGSTQEQAVMDRLAAELDLKPVSALDIHLEASELSRIMSDSRNITKNKLLFFHSFCYYRHNKQYLDYIRMNQIEEKEPIYFHFNALTSESSVKSEAFLELYRGTYRLLRPSPFNADEKFCECVLTIGSESSPFDCRLVTRFTDAHGRERTSIADGKIIPDTDHATAIFGFQQAGMGVIQFDTVELDHGEQRKVLDLKGLMLVDLKGSGPASAWPVYAERVENQEVQAREIEVADISDLPQHVTTHLFKPALR